MSANEEIIDSALQAAPLLERIASLESSARILAATAFGLALILSAIQLQRKQTPKPVPGVPSASRLLLIAGLVFAVCHLAFAVSLPAASSANLVIPALICLLSASVVAIDFDHDKLPAFTFLTSAISWILLVLTPFLFQHQNSGIARELTLLARFHIFGAIVGASTFALGCLTSIVYIFVHTRLKKKLLEDTSSLPSLQSLERLVQRTHVIGLALITSSLVSGLGLLNQGFSLKDVGIVKIVWAFAIWLWYVVSIFGRAKWGWRGRKGATLSVLGALLMSLALFGAFSN